MHSIRRPVRLLALVSALAVLLVALAGTGAGAESNDFGLAYTGGSAGKADKKLAPITIGYINQEGGVPSFPEATAGINAAVKYVNNELGGAQKHPVVVKKCTVLSMMSGGGRKSASNTITNSPLATLSPSSSAPALNPVRSVRWR